MNVEAIILANNTRINTVKGQQEQSSLLDQRRADKARKLQNILNVSTQDLTTAVNNQQILNCPITRKDIKMADLIYGPPLASLKGKTTCRSEGHVHVEISPVPPDILHRYHNVTIDAGIMYVNQTKFFVTISRHIQFATAEVMKEASNNAMARCVDHVLATYLKQGFKVSIINMGVQFYPIKTEIETNGVTVNYVSTDEHVPEVERFIRTIKERTRGIQCTLPFDKFSLTMIIEMVVTGIF